MAPLSPDLELIDSKGYLRETSKNCTMHLTFQNKPRELSKAGKIFYIPEKIKKWPKTSWGSDAPD